MTGIVKMSDAGGQSNTLPRYVSMLGGDVASSLPTSIDYLVIAGGGGGGYAGNTAVGGGGGGAGGYQTGTNLSFAGTRVLTITVGAGGAPGFAASNGSDSSINALIVSTGGGRGGGPYSGPALGAGGNGGSGGGAAEPAQNLNYLGGTGVSGQGFGGGTANGTTNGGVGANGGGAGGVGTNTIAWPTATNTAPANGVSNSITGSAITYATGGRGGQPWSTSTLGANGAANKGDGGGGSIGNSSSSSNGVGGSGIVVVKYADSFAAATATSGSPTYTVSGGFRIYTFNASGSLVF